MDRELSEVLLRRALSLRQPMCNSKLIVLINSIAKGYHKFSPQTLLRWNDSA